MFWLIYCVVSAQVLALNSAILESKLESHNEEQPIIAHVERSVVVSSEAKAILITAEEGDGPSPDSNELNVNNTLETRDCGLYTAFCARKKEPGSESPPRSQSIKIPDFPEEYDKEGRLISYWKTEAYRKWKESIPPRKKTRKEKARDFMHTVEPLLHFCCCCCLAHICD